MPDINILINAKDQSSAAINNVTGAIDNLDKKATLASVASGGLGKLTNVLGTAIKASAAITTTALVGIGGAIAVTGTNFNNMAQQAEIAFETMLGSGAKAKSFLDELKEFAAQTPFDFPELVQASQRMLAMGFESSRVLPTLTAIGDAVAALGGSSEMVGRVTTALGQMQAKGKASGEEMMQLTEAGIPAWQMLADAIGVDTAEAMDMVSKGAVSADTAITAIVEGMNQKFGGLMAQQSATFGGLLSTIKDTFAQVSGQVMAPLFVQMTAGLQSIVDWTSKPEFTAGVAALAGWIERVTTQAVAWVTSVWPSVMTALESVRGVIDLLVTGDFRGGIFGMVEDDPFIRALLAGRAAGDFLVKTVGNLVETTWDWASRVLPPLVENLMKAVDWVTRVKDAALIIVRPLTDTIGKFVDFDDVMAAIGILLAGPVVAAIGSLVAGLATFLAPIAAVTAAVAALRWAWENDFGRVRTFTQSTLEKMSDWFFEESGVWKGTWEKTLQYLTWWGQWGWRDAFYNPVVKWVSDFSRNTITTFNNWVINTDKAFNEWWSGVVHYFVSLKDDIVASIVHWTSEAQRQIEYWVGRADTEITVFVNGVRRTFEDWRDGVLRVYDQMVKDVEAWRNKYFGWFKPTEWFKTGLDMITGLWDGLKEAWRTLTAWWRGESQTLGTEFERIYDMHSPSRVFADYGKNLMEGLAGGITAAANAPLGALAQIHNTVLSSVKGMTNAVGGITGSLGGITGNTTAGQAPSGPTLGDVLGANKPNIPAIKESVSLIGGITLNASELVEKEAQAVMGSVSDLTKTLMESLRRASELIPESTAQVEYPINTLLQNLSDAINDAGKNLRHSSESNEFKLALQGLTKFISTEVKATQQEVAKFVPDPEIDRQLQLMLQDLLQTLARGGEQATAAVEASEAAKNAPTAVGGFVAGIGDFLEDTLKTAESVMQKVVRMINGPGGVRDLGAAWDSSETKMITEKLQDMLYDGIQGSIEAIIGPSADVNFIGAERTKMIDRVKDVIAGLGADTSVEVVEDLLQRLVDFRNLANVGTDVEFYKNLLPTDSRLTGSAAPTTNNSFNITLQGGGDASANLLSTFDLLNSLYGTAP